MTGAAVAALAVVTAACLVAWLLRERGVQVARGPVGAAVLAVLLGGSALAAQLTGPARGPGAVAAVILAVVVAVAGGAVVVPALLDLAEPRAGERAEGERLLRGGAWIGALERAAVTGTVVAGWPEGVAVVVAVKGLGRYAELKSPAASERFIVGTLSSLLWAVAAAGTAVLLLR